jgi:hypothetical protein
MVDCQLFGIRKALLQFVERTDYEINGMWIVARIILTPRPVYGSSSSQMLEQMPRLRGCVHMSR